MQLTKSVALLLAGLSAAQGYRDQSTKKSAQNSRHLENDGLDCIVVHDAAQTDAEVQVHLGTFPGEGKGLFKITIKDEPFGSDSDPVVTFGWCIDYDRYIDKGYWSMDIFSAYDADVHMGAVDDHSMLMNGNLAFLINNVNVGDLWPAQGDCEGAMINWKDLQGAIWKLIDDKDGTGTWYAKGRTECVAEQIAQYARDHGNGYELDCHDPNEEVPLILISDNNAEVVLNQVIVSETNIHSVEGLCSCSAAVVPAPEPAPEPRGGPSDDPKGVCKDSISMDFETDGNGQPTSAGQRAKDMYESLGIEILTNYGNSKPAMLFDSANPTGGDNDLFSDEHGMILIISEDNDSSDPDDNVGGRIIIKFNTPVCYESMGFLDFEEQSYIKFFDADNKSMGDRISAPIMGDGESKRMDVNTCGIKKMVMIFGGSGAITDIEYCLDGPEIVIPEPEPEPEPGTCGHTCDCFTCDSVTEKDDGTIDVKVGHCKDGSISWMCCTGVDGGNGNCDVVEPCFGPKCETIPKGGGLTVNVPKDATSFSINTHDGQTSGTGNINSGVCGGSGNQGGRCAKDGFTAHCDIDFNIAEHCGYTPPAETKINVCVEDGDSYTMLEILESAYDGQPKPGDEVVINGEKYKLADDCTPERIIEVCVLNGDRYIIAEIPESDPDADSALKAGDEVEIDGIKYILADDCDLEKLVPICVKNGDEYTMTEINENELTDQVQPGDEVVVDGVTYILADDCALNPTVVICVEDPPGTFTMEVILTSELGNQAVPGDEVTVNGSQWTLDTTCSLSLIPDPTDPPTDAPTVAPTDAPTTSPKTPAPSAPPRNMPTPTEEKTPAPTKGSGSGDPHFKTWTGDKYDYHGECDLVLVNNPTFMDGLGLRVHIRTTRVKYFSFIEKVAVQIGNNTLEFDNDVDRFYIDGKHVGKNQEHEKTMLNKFVVRRDPKALSIRIQDEGTPEARRAGRVAKIDLHTRKNGFPAVIVDAGQTDLFEGSVGMLGEYGTGRTLARDGKTEMIATVEDAEDFALEWQVRDTEPSLFKKRRFPQFPDFCTPPKKMLGGRLGLWKVKEEAEEACAHWKEDKDDCIFDVMATRDVLVAEEGHIVHIE